MTVKVKGRKARKSRELLLGFYDTMVKLVGGERQPVEGFSNARLKRLCEALWEEQSDAFRELYLKDIANIMAREPVKIVWNLK